MWETSCSHEPGGGLQAFSGSSLVFVRFVEAGVPVSLLAVEARPFRLVPFSGFSGRPPMSSKYSFSTSAAVSLPLSAWSQAVCAARVHVLLGLPGAVLGVVIALPLHVELQNTFVKSVAENLLDDVSVGRLAHAVGVAGQVFAHAHPRQRPRHLPPPPQALQALLPSCRPSWTPWSRERPRVPRTLHR